MATKSTALRNSQADSLVANLVTLEVLDANSNVIGSGSISGWTTASSGEVDFDSDVSVTGNSNAGDGADIAEARLVGSTSEELTGITVTQTGGGGDIEVENTNITDGQTLTVTSLAITEPAETQ